MKSSWSKTLEWCGRIVAIGVVAMIIAAAIELALIGIACGIGITVWIFHDLLTGLGAGIASFIVGQFVVYLVVESYDLLPDPAGKSRSEN